MNKIKLLLWKFWREERLILLLSVGFAAVAVLGLWRWISLPSPKYFLPLSAADWAAWGTCFGAVGTIAAVVYAARALSSETRDRRRQMSHLELEEAKSAANLSPLVHAWSVNGEGTWAAQAGISVTNNLWDQSFKDVQILVSPTTLLQGVTLTNIKVQKNAQVFVEYLQGWQLAEDKWVDVGPASEVLPGQNYWTLGEVGPREALRVVFDFSPPVEPFLAWTNQDYAVSAFEHPQKLLAVTFLDARGLEWLRTSQDDGKAKRIRLNELARE